MLGIKKLIMGLVIGLLLGLWAGVNIGHDRPIWSNPFEERALTDKAKDAAADVWKDAKKAAREQLDD